MRDGTGRATRAEDQVEARVARRTLGAWPSSRSRSAAKRRSGERRPDEAPEAARWGVAGAHVGQRLTDISGSSNRTPCRRGPRSVLAWYHSSMECYRTSNCPMYSLFNLKATMGVWKALHCEGPFADCERLKLFEAGKPVPVNLLPNGKLLEMPPATSAAGSDPVDNAQALPTASS